MTERPASDMASSTSKARVCVVGAGPRFLSGISYYTWRLANALSTSFDVSVILMRQLIPQRLYPGKDRVGANLTTMQYNDDVKVFDGVDWHWIPSMVRALAFLARTRPHFVVFQWWTGAVLHSYLLLALAARLRGSRVIVEFHEVQDTGEAQLFIARHYVGLLGPLLMRLASGFVVHSEFDRPVVVRRYGLKNQNVAVIPIGPFDHHKTPPYRHSTRTAPQCCCNCLYFGVIRPYKGVEDLIRAFESIPEEEIGDYWLTVVGETWENWTLPAELIEGSRYRDRITFVNRYVTDEEVADYFDAADVVVLPYHRSSASGPLHVAMSHGLPVVVTEVGGLVEAVNGYEGAILIPPHDPIALRSALSKAAFLRGRRFSAPHSWSSTVSSYDVLFKLIRSKGSITIDASVRQ